MCNAIKSNGDMCKHKAKYDGKCGYHNKAADNEEHDDPIDLLLNKIEQLSEQQTQMATKMNAVASELNDIKSTLTPLRALAHIPILNRYMQ